MTMHRYGHTHISAPDLAGILDKVSLLSDVTSSVSEILSTIKSDTLSNPTAEYISNKL